MLFPGVALVSAALLTFVWKMQDTGRSSEDRNLANNIGSGKKGGTSNRLSNRGSGKSPSRHVNMDKNRDQMRDLHQLWKKDQQLFEEHLLDRCREENIDRDFRLILWDFVRHRPTEILRNDTLAKAVSKALSGPTKLPLESFEDLDLMEHFYQIAEAGKLSFQLSPENFTSEDIRQILRSADRSRFIAQVSVEFAKSRPAETLESLNDLDLKQKAEIIRGSVEGFLTTLPKEAIEQIQKDLDSVVYQEFADELFERWVGRDPIAAGNALDGMAVGPVKDQGIVELVEYLMDASDTEKARVWINEIQNPEIRARLTKKFELSLD